MTAKWAACAPSWSAHSPAGFCSAPSSLAGVAVSVVQVYIFLAIAWFWDIKPPAWGYVAALPALILSGLMLGALGLVLSSFIRQLENFAGVMNFVIFPMFFLSSALYPLWRMQQADTHLYWLSQANPFTHAVEARSLRPLRALQSTCRPHRHRIPGPLHGRSPSSATIQAAA